MNIEEFPGREQSLYVENLAAELSDAAYRQVLTHGVGEKWLDLQLDLWNAFTQAIKKQI